MPVLIIFLILILLLFLKGIVVIFKDVFFRKTSVQDNLYDDYYVHTRTLYSYRFKAIPSTQAIYGIDASKAFNFIQSRLQYEIVDILQSCYFSYDDDKSLFNKTLFVLKSRTIIELTTDAAKVFYTNGGKALADEIIQSLKDFRNPVKQEDFEINIITLNGSGLDLKRLDIKPSSLDIDLFYNDDFKEVDKLIKQRLNNMDDKGIVLLHGLPGTGKTSYLRHLIGELKKKVLFVSPSVAANLMNPEFIDILIDNPNSIVIIEDAENIIMDRKVNKDSSVSNLLNLSDGLLSDCLNVQIICTFNNAISLIDSALMRKGRLIAKYEFGKLTIEKAKSLSRHFGIEQKITQPMTIAEIANPTEVDNLKKTEIIGFRMTEQLVN